jgi:hypothetical protein
MQLAIAFNFIKIAIEIGSTLLRVSVICSQGFNPEKPWETFHALADRHCNLSVGPDSVRVCSRRDANTGASALDRNPPDYRATASGLVHRKGHL